MKKVLFLIAVAIGSQCVWAQSRNDAEVRVCGVSMRDIRTATEEGSTLEIPGLTSGTITYDKTKGGLVFDNVNIEYTGPTEAIFVGDPNTTLTFIGRNSISIGASESTEDRYAIYYSAKGVKNSTITGDRTQYCELLISDLNHKGGYTAGIRLGPSQNLNLKGIYLSIGGGQWGVEGGNLQARLNVTDDALLKVWGREKPFESIDGVSCKQSFMTWGESGNWHEYKTGITFQDGDAYCDGEKPGQSDCCYFGEFYDVAIGGVYMNSAHKYGFPSNVGNYYSGLHEGNAYYSPTNKTLTLEETTVTSTRGIVTGIDGLTIRLRGENKLLGIYSSADGLTIVGRAGEWDEVYIKEYNAKTRQKTAGGARPEVPARLGESDDVRGIILDKGELTLRDMEFYSYWDVPSDVIRAQRLTLQNIRATISVDTDKEPLKIECTTKDGSEPESWIKLIDCFITGRDSFHPSLVEVRELTVQKGSEKTKSCYLVFEGDEEVVRRWIDVHDGEGRFGVSVNDLDLTTSNYRNIAGNGIAEGTVAFSPNARRLMLKGCDMAGDIIVSYLDTSVGTRPKSGGLKPRSGSWQVDGGKPTELEIFVEKPSKVRRIFSYIENLTISGTKLNINNNSTFGGITFGSQNTDCTVTFTLDELDVHGRDFGIHGSSDHKRTVCFKDVQRATIESPGGKAIRGLSTDGLILEGCHMAEPKDAELDENGDLRYYDGGLILARRVVILNDNPSGDLNGDGDVNVGDVTTLVNMILGKAETSPAADLNGDGDVNVGDVTTLVNMILGK